MNVSWMTLQFACPELICLPTDDFIQEVKLIPRMDDAKNG